MIAIQVGSKYLDLLPSTKVNFKIKSDFFEQNERAVSSHTLPFDIPRTSQNERIFQYVSLSEIQNNEALHECQIYLYNLPWKKGTIEILSWEKDTYKITVFTDISIFLLRMEDSLKSLDLGSVITGTNFGTNQSYFDNSSAMQLYVNASVSHTWTDACAFPQMLASNFFENISYEGYINQYVYGSNRYENAVASIAPNTVYPFVPCVFVRYVLEKIQGFCNCKIEGDFMTDAELQKMLIVNNYTINVFAFNAFYLTNQIDFKNHLPDISIRAFLGQLADILNYSIQYDEVENKIIFVKKESVFEVGNYQDLSKQFCKHTSGETINGKTNYQITFPDGVLSTFPLFENQNLRIEKIELGASTLATSFSLNNTIFTSKLNSSVASKQLSDSEEFSYVSPNSENNLRFVFWQGLQPNANGFFPQSANFTPSQSPNLFLDPSFLYNNTFIKFIKAKETTKKYNSEFLFTVTDILNFDINKPIRVNSVTYVPTEASINIDLQGVEPVQITQFRI
jgi:hypothetical protein